MDNLQVFDRDCREIGADRGAFPGDAAKMDGEAASAESGERSAERNAEQDAVEERNRRIRKEKNRLKKQFKGIDDRNRAMVEGLIEQAAFMRVKLQDLSDDIIENGVTELFSQGKDQEPYERQRPAANVYNSMNGNYQKIIKQLNDLLPKPLKAERGDSDGFIDFVADRDAF